jgi:hypothetical protein
MLNRKLTITLLALVNSSTVFIVASKFGLASLNNWLLIVSTFFFSTAVYKILGMVEGYKN